MIRFIHVADLHLDSPFKGIKRAHSHLFDAMYEATFASFRRVIDRAIKEQVDFVLISGDIYEEENQSVKAQARFRDELNRLNEQGIPAYVLHGNHDFMAREALRIQLPNSVHVFDTAPETVHLQTASNERVSITGFSYATRWVKERMIDAYPSRDHTCDYHIGMLHGFLEGSDSSEQVYAPFRLDDLIDRNYDYWALGHIHKRNELAALPPIVYAGNIQGRNPNEKGPKGAYLVSLQKGTAPVFDFFETAPIEWQETSVSVKEVHTFDRIFERLRETVQAFEIPDKTILLSIQLTDAEGLSKEILEKIELGDVTEALNHDAPKNVSVYRVKVVAPKNRTLFPFDETMQESFLRSQQSLSQTELFQELIKELAKHPVVRTRVPEMVSDASFQEEVQSEATALLLEEIIFEEGEEPSED